MKYWKKILLALSVLFAIVFFSLYGANVLVIKSATSKIYDKLEDVPYNKVGLLLGTAKMLSNGQVNLYYKYRIDAAVKLFKSGKIDYVLVSGDNSTKDYDEPTTMMNDLIENGVPATRIYLDYAGFRTLDSVVRCKEIFGQMTVTIISQKFHNERALYIAKSHGIEAAGFNATDVNVKYGFKTQLREKFARVKMILDLTFGKQPKFFGDKVQIK